MTPDPYRLLIAATDALNALKRDGLVVDLEHGALLTRHGYVMAIGDPRLGLRWAVRMRAPQPPVRNDGED